MIQRKVKRYGGSLGFIIGKFECENNNIEEDDDIIIEIKEVIKCKKKTKKSKGQ